MRRAELPFYLLNAKMYREGVLAHAYALVVVIYRRAGVGLTERQLLSVNRDA